jgi:hypothetical protein
LIEEEWQWKKWDGPAQVGLSKLRH